jgi:hypothetical protein
MIWERVITNSVASMNGAGPIKIDPERIAKSPGVVSHIPGTPTSHKSPATGAAIMAVPKSSTKVTLVSRGLKSNCNQTLLRN